MLGSSVNQQVGSRTRFKGNLPKKIIRPTKARSVEKTVTTATIMGTRSSGHSYHLCTRNSSLQQPPLLLEALPPLYLSCIGQNFKNNVTINDKYLFLTPAFTGKMCHSFWFTVMYQSLKVLEKSSSIHNTLKDLFYFLLILWVFFPHQT